MTSYAVTRHGTVARLTVGCEVRLLADVAPWYSGYGANPSVLLEAGMIGYVRSVDVPRVRGRGARYAVAVFELDGSSW